MMPPAKTGTSPSPLSRISATTRGSSVLCAPLKMLKPDRVHIFLHSGFGDHLGCLAQAGIDHFHAGVAQRARDDFGAAVVTVQAGFCNEDTDGHGDILREGA